MSGDYILWGQPFMYIKVHSVSQCKKKKEIEILKKQWKQLFF